jgi:fatty-acyl-CoA synthase
MSIVFRKLSPVSFLQRAAAVFADRPAVVDREFRCGYGEFWQRAQRLAARGAGLGSRGAVPAPNTHLLLEADYGLPAAGAVLVAMNTRLAAAEIAYILSHSDARLVLVDADYDPMLAEALRDMAGPPEVIGSADYEVLVAAAEPYRAEPADERSLLSLNYTGGTTGRPKGVMYHHRGGYLQALAMAHHVGLDTSSRYLWTLPMFHTNGWFFPWAVTAAGTVHHCLRAVALGVIWVAIAEDGVTHFCAAPTVLATLAKHPDAAAPDHIVRTFAGGAPPWPALLSRMRALGIDVRHLYGLTETYGPAMVCEWQPKWEARSGDEQARLIARQGIPSVIAEPLSVIDSPGGDVPANRVTTGEVALRGNDVMLGYYRDAEATAAASIGGWFRTGRFGRAAHRRVCRAAKPDQGRDHLRRGGHHLTGGGERPDHPPGCLRGRGSGRPLPEVGGGAGGLRQPARRLGAGAAGAGRVRPGPDRPVQSATPDHLRRAAQDLHRQATEKPPPRTTR